jgi:hypothetical protein
VTTFCVEVEDDCFAEVTAHFADIGWTITGQRAVIGGRTTFVEVDASDAPAEVDGWLCSPTIVRGPDGAPSISDYGPLVDLRKAGRAT